MFKNVAGQKLRVFAFDATTNLPKTGDAANLTAYVSKDYGAVTVLGDTTATEEEVTNAAGFYLFDLAQAETNADYLGFSGKSVTANVVVVAVPGVVYTVPPNFTAAKIDAGGTADASLVAVGLDRVLTESGIAAGPDLTDDAGTQLTAINARQALAVLLSALAGADAGGGTTAMTFKPAGVAAGNTRISGTVDTSGNRSAVALKVPV